MTFGKDRPTWTEKDSTQDLTVWLPRPEKGQFNIVPKRVLIKVCFYSSRNGHRTLMFHLEQYFFKIQIFFKLLRKRELLSDYFENTNFLFFTPNTTTVHPSTKYVVM